MARWYGYTMEQTRGLLMTEFYMFEEFTAQHPPADLILAARYGVSKSSIQKPLTYEQAASANNGAMMLIPKEFGKHASLSDMPKWVQDSQALKKKIREELKAKYASGE